MATVYRSIRNRRQGSTLVEVVVVVIVLAILATIGFAVFANHTENTKDTVAQVSVTEALKVGAVIYAENRNALPDEADLVNVMNNDYGGLQYKSYTADGDSTGPDDVSVVRDANGVMSVCARSETGRVYCARESYDEAGLALAAANPIEQSDNDPGFFEENFASQAHAAGGVKLGQTRSRSTCVGVAEADTRACLASHNTNVAAHSVGLSNPNWDDTPESGDQAEAPDPDPTPDPDPEPEPDPEPTYLSYNNEVSNDGPTATCPFDESGSAYVNLSCTGINGQLQDQSPRFSTQQDGAILTNTASKAVYFNGATHYSYGNPSGQSTGNNVTNWSVEIWAKPQTGAQNQTLISGDDNWSLDTAGGSGFRCVMRTGSPWATDSISGGNPAQAGQWHHVVCTYSSGTLKLYVNGVEVASKAGVASGQSGTGNIRPGYAGGWWNSTGYFQGTLDQFSFYKGNALTPERVAAHYGSAGY